MVYRLSGKLLVAQTGEVYGGVLLLLTRFASVELFKVIFCGYIFIDTSIS